MKFKSVFCAKGMKTTETITFFDNIMPSFSIYDLLFFIWIMFLNIIRKYFFNKKTIKSSSSIMFLNFFPIMFFWWKIYFFPVIFTYIQVLLFFAGVFWFPQHLNQLVQHSQCIYYIFYWWDFLLLFLIKSREPIDDLAWFRYILWHL